MKNIHRAPYATKRKRRNTTVREFTFIHAVARFFLVKKKKEEKNRTKGQAAAIIVHTVDTHTLHLAVENAFSDSSAKKRNVARLGDEIDVSFIPVEGFRQQ